MVSPTLTRPVGTTVRVPVSPIPPAAGHGGASPRRPRWSLRRTSAGISVMAAVTAVWLGLTAPSVSPVTPAAPLVAVVGTTAGTTTDPAQGVTGVVPTVAVPAPAPDVVDGPRRGRGGR